MSPRLLLVDPPFHAFFEYDRWWFSFACAQLAAYTRAAGIDTFVYDADRYGPRDPATKSRAEMVRRQPRFRRGLSDDGHPVWTHFREALDTVQPDVVGVTAWTCKHPSTLKILEITKAHNPSISTCVGGYHATALPDVFAAVETVDAVFVGPAEQTLPEWVEGGCPPGTVWAEPHSVDTEDAPPPARDALLHPESFTAYDMGMIMTSRGCPHNCIFCSNRMLSGLRRQRRRAEAVREEIATLVERYGPEYLNVADAEFLAGPRGAYDVEDVLASTGLPWGCEGRIDAVTNDRIRRLVERGAKTLSFGIETGTDRGLSRLRKGFSTDQVLRAAEILHRHDVTWKCFFILGFPFETIDDMEATRRFGLELDADVLSLNAFCPLPGTELYQEFKARIDAAPCELWEFNQLNPCVSLMDGVTDEAYREKFMEVLEDFDAHNRRKQALDAFHEGSFRNSALESGERSHVALLSRASPILGPPSTFPAAPRPVPPR